MNHQPVVYVNFDSFDTAMMLDTALGKLVSQGESNTQQIQTIINTFSELLNKILRDIRLANQQLTKLNVPHTEQDVTLTRDLVDNFINEHPLLKSGASSPVQPNINAENQEQLEDRLKEKLALVFSPKFKPSSSGKKPKEEPQYIPRIKPASPV